MPSMEPTYDSLSFFLFLSLSLCPTPLLTCCLSKKKKKKEGVPGLLNQLSLPLLVSDQIMISWFVSVSPASGSVLTVWSLFGILFLPFSLSLPCSLSLCLSKIKLKKKIKKKKDPGGLQVVPHPAQGCFLQSEALNPRCPTAVLMGLKNVHASALYHHPPNIQRQQVWAEPRNLQ